MIRGSITDYARFRNGKKQRIVSAGVVDCVPATGSPAAGDDSPDKVLPPADAKAHGVAVGAVLGRHDAGGSRTTEQLHLLDDQRLAGDWFREYVPAFFYVAVQNPIPKMAAFTA